MDDSCYDEEDMEEPTDGEIFIVGNSLYRWDSTSSTFIGLEDETDILSSDYMDNALYVDDSARIDGDGDNLEDGRLYRAKDKNIYLWNAMKDQFEGVSNSHIVNYLQSVLMDMKLM